MNEKDLGADAAEGAPARSAEQEVARKQPLKMHAYYFGFTPTGIELVDRVLSAVAHAGKGYHHTEDWTEPTEDWDVFRGGSYAAWIQRAAEDAAESQRELLEALKELISANNGDSFPPIQVAMRKAKAAIAKAEGHH